MSSRRARWRQGSSTRFETGREVQSLRDASALELMRRCPTEVTEMGLHRIRRAGSPPRGGAGRLTRPPAVQQKGSVRNQTLGAYLYHVRKIKRLTLRQVEEATMQKVSNSYLSQLEHDRVTNPSPNILHWLAEVYAISYAVLMEKSGYVSTSRGRARERRRRRVSFASKDLTSQEEEELLRYLAFLRSRVVRK